MKYDFDEIVPRRGTNAIKWDMDTDPEVLPMWVADMDFRTAPAVAAALQRRVQHDIFGYATAPKAYYDAITGWFRRRHGWQIRPEWVLHTTGVIPALSAVIKALTQPGDKVLIQTPVYNHFFTSIHNSGCQAAESPLVYRDNTYTIDFDDLERKAAAPAVKLMLLCNPHNPAGRVWTPAELHRIGELCLRHDVVVVADEIHCELVMPGFRYTPFASLCEEFERRSVTCTSPSKAFNLAGLQVANIFAADAALRARIGHSLQINETGEIGPFAIEALIAAFARKGDEFARVLKMGRTQLQDAVPMTLGQTFHGFASVLRGEVDNLDHAAQEFLSINMGATAIGTGICAEPGYAERCTAAIREITGWDVTLAEDLVGATSDTVCMVGYSSAMKRIASKMNKICNDLRLLSSGPRCGLGEFNLPARQPGSSIMPGKVNPVIPEVMNQIAFKVIGNELCVTMADEAAQMELNAMEPVMAQCCFESAELLINGFDTLRIRCVDGITANEEKCLQYVRNSIGVVTALNPIIGYKNSTKIAKEALETGRGVYELVLEHGILNRDELDEVLRPENMIHPVKLDIKPRR